MNSTILQTSSQFQKNSSTIHNRRQKKRLQFVFFEKVFRLNTRNINQIRHTFRKSMKYKRN